jgi:predicted nucleic acid-binding Zn ribbon protein
VLQKFSDPPVTQCELCHGKMKKLISQSTFHLKGTGWYVTDYASKTNASGDKRGEKVTDKEAKTKETKGSSDKSKKDASSKDASSKDTSSKDASSAGGKKAKD